MRRCVYLCQDLHYYHFSDYDREALRGPIGTQVVRFAAELDSLPAAVVGEYSACPPPGCTVDRTEFFAHQLQVAMVAVVMLRIRL
jgi:hypothetical protein